MSLSYHLIDGYNLLHAAGLARERYGPRDLERARFALLLRIADGLDESERTRTVVVFDAADPPPEGNSCFRYRELTIEFAPDGGDADAYIEALIRGHSSPRQLRVVSDDHRIRQAAKRRGAQAVKCDAFLNRLNRRAHSSQPAVGAASPKSIVSDAENDDWKSFFGLTDAELTASPKEIVSDRLEAAKPEERTAKMRRSGATEASPPTETPRVRKASTAQDPDDLRLGNDEAKFWQDRIDQMLNESSLKTKPPHHHR